MNWKRFLSLTAILLPLTQSLFAATNAVPALLPKIVPPAPPREFRAAWITEVAANPDWPLKPGLPVAEQKAEIVWLLDGAAQMHFNAVFFQVRPACDAFYASSIEPWSDRITGVMGRAPEPFFDPLAFAIAEAHRRGLQLHAWFNPFRAAHPDSKSPRAPNHITLTHPEFIRRYAGEIWLDPGEPEVRNRTVSVVLDVVKRYDVDGVIFDDYFYPYPAKDAAGRKIDFPDDATWKKYGSKTGMSRDDWRRDNVNQVVRNVSQSVKAAKPWVQFGISPFGIWRPSAPASIDPKALDAYGKLYADARAWLANGWLDYLAPQLYWPIADQPHSFVTLLDWWRSQNAKGRHVWPALSAANVGTKFSADEIPRQIQVVRQRNDPGEAQYHLRSVLENSTLAARVRAQYATPALVPASPWLAVSAPCAPKLSVTVWKKYTHAQWQPTPGKAAGSWLFQMRTNGVWTTQVLAPGMTDFDFANANPDVVAIRAADRLGNLSEPAVWQRTN